MEVSGKIKVINPEIQVSATFRKRELVVSTDEQYPQHILVNFVQDKCDILSAYKIGEQVKVGINIRGREWVSPAGETKYFNDIQGWKIDRVGGGEAPNQNQAMPPMPAAEAFAPATNFKEEEHDDLPF